MSQVFPSDAVCFRDDCSRRPIPAARVSKMLPGFAAVGMCPHHTMAAAVESMRRKGEVVTEPQPVDMYRPWVAKFYVTGTLTVQGLTVKHVTKAMLSEMTGVNRNTLTHIATGRIQSLNAPTAHALLPWTIYADPRQAANERFKIHHTYRVQELKGLPLGSVVIDSRGLSWQLHGYSHAPVWRPAADYLYQPGVPLDTLRGTVTVLYIPAQQLIRSRI